MGILPTPTAAEVVASYADLGAFQLLLPLQDDDALLTYCRGVLGPVEAGEGEYGDELLRSLDVFIEHNGHWEKAARRAVCHRHTLRYRIRRVEQLTGREFLDGARSDRVLAPRNASQNSIRSRIESRPVSCSTRRMQ